MKFLLFHGAFGFPEENWLPQLKDSLLALGQEVIVPKFPVDDYYEITKNGPKADNKYQTLSNWLRVFEKEVLPQIRGEKVCFVGHSLSPVFILHVIDKYGDQFTVDAGIFVSPFLKSLERDDLWQFEVVNKTFYKTDFDFNKLKKLIPESYVLYSESDPYIPTEYFKEFASYLDSSIIRVKSAGHLNAAVNLNEFPLVYELCKSRLDLNLYQKYISHRRELYGIDYINPSEEVIYLKPQEYYDEGIFKFRNLQKHGFCTLLTSIKEWDTQSQYMQACRNAARRMNNLVRVFIVDKIDDLERPLLQEQVKLDIESQVKVYFVMKKDVEAITEHLDFGVWDEEYLCTVTPEEARLSSRDKDIKEGTKWEKEILKVATQIDKYPEDVEKFLKENKV